MKKVSELALAIIKTSLARGVQDKDALSALKRELTRGSGRGLPTTTELRQAYETIIAADPAAANAGLDRLLRRRDVRSLSGVAIITVLTKPYPCPGRCLYCPTERNMPKSYLANEPAAMRAVDAGFDPWRQVSRRLRALQGNGHPSDKIELIVKGGTWSAYPWQYQQWFIKRCFDACNNFGGTVRRSPRTLAAAQVINETATHRVIGLTLETRPDRITPTEIVRLRELGCTRVELGVQSVNDRLLLRVQRGHDAAAVIRATRLLKDAGYKTDFHLMPQLPGATPASDLRDLRTIFSDPGYRPDMIKVYPCVVLESAALYQEWKRGAYVPYSDRKLLELLIEFKTGVPPYCRISRLIRDIPSTSIKAGNPVTNLRQDIARIMAERGLRCRCLRCREIGHAAKDRPALLAAAPKLFDLKYEASGGLEHFLSFEDRSRRGVFAFCRLRLPGRDGVRERRSQGETESGRDGVDRKKLYGLLPEIRGAAFLRELHTYGHLVPIAAHDPRASQHKGLGRRLMAEAERLAKKAGYKKLAVISGVGVRGYYRKLGYRRQGTYMLKRLA
ncbi:MAG: tRNA uridine(34) 5-carboxymethylaminomethyl modification radical SAM/GNAT enzyme Elp3 [Patescibacteria group bacterium]|jgi:elongator complex protein 3